MALIKVFKIIFDRAHSITARKRSCRYRVMLPGDMSGTDITSKKSNESWSILKLFNNGMKQVLTNADFSPLRGFP